MAGTRSTTGVKKDKRNLSLIELGFDPVVDEGEENPEEEDEGPEEQMTPVSMREEDIDPIWEKLSRLPFFQTATKKRQEELYFREREKEEERQERMERVRKEEREFELQKMQIQQQQQNAIGQSAAARPHVKVSLPAWESSSKIEKFLETCERLLLGAKVPQDLWVAHIVPKLS
jgi:hypothetical protein